MSCACENRRMGQELDRIRRIAKAWAKMEEEIVAIFRNDDGSYGFTSISNEIEKPIVEYVTPY